MFDDDEDFEPGPDDYDIIKMVRTSVGETVLGVVVYEDEETIELAWPALLQKGNATVNGSMVSISMMTVYGTAFFRDMVPFNKLQLIYCADADEDLDEFYFNMLPKLYDSANPMPPEPEFDEDFYMGAEDPYLMSDNKVDSEVTKIAIANRDESLEQMIERITGNKKTIH